MDAALDGEIPEQTDYYSPQELFDHIIALDKRIRVLEAAGKNPNSYPSQMGYGGSYITTFPNAGGSIGGSSLSYNTAPTTQKDTHGILHKMLHQKKPPIKGSQRP